MTFGLNKLSGFDNHKLISFVNDDYVGLYGFIAIHRGNNEFPAFGATRLWNYRSTNDALIDALRLSKTMSYKAALAGLKCGGAKATLISEGVSVSRNKFLKSYAEKVNYLSGRFITGADVGIDRGDVLYMRRFSKYIVGVKVDPVRFTVLGLLSAIKACSKEVFGSVSINEKSFALQGVGKVGSELLRNIYGKAGKIYVYDIDSDRLKTVLREFPRIKVVKSGEIDQLKVDFFAPCALSNCINSKNIKKLHAAVIVGGANCQLETDELSVKLQKKSILYIPDYVANAGGLVSVYDEYENGNLRIKRIEKRVKRIKNTVSKLIKLSKKNKTSPFIEANLLAESIIKKYE